MANDRIHVGYGVFVFGRFGDLNMAQQSHGGDLKRLKGLINAFKEALTAHVG
jgi:hypothetical protein